MVVSGSCLKLFESEHEKKTVHNTIENNYMIKAMHQFNLKWSLLEYFQESEGTMKNKLTTIRQKLKRKMDADVL